MDGMNRKELKAKISEFPTTPGVYLMKDAKGVVIYVGKAKSLRGRVASYFQDSPGDTRAKVETMVPRVADVEYVEAESEVDALLMEARLIKDIQPKYNEDLRDSKLYPYLEITRSEDFPGVYVTRQRDNPRNKFYGPFTDTRGLRAAVVLMQRAFRFRTCTLEIRDADAKRRFNRPCLLYYIERCTGPCAALISREEYRNQIDLFQRFLEGKRKRVLASLEEEMRRYSAEMKYEKAGRIRDQLRALEALAKRGSLDIFPEAVQPPVMEAGEAMQELQKLFGLSEKPRTIEGIDAAHLGGSDSVGSVVTFLDGRPFKSGYRRFRIKSFEGIDDYAMIGEVVERRYRRLRDEEMPLPDILLIDGGKGQLHAAMERLRRVRVKIPVVVSIAKKEELLYRGLPPKEIKLPRTSPALRVLQYVRDEAHRFGVHYHHILRGKRLKAQI